MLRMPFDANPLRRVRFLRVGGFCPPSYLR